MPASMFQTPSSYIGKRGPDLSGIDWTKQDTQRITKLYGPKKNQYNPSWLRSLPSSVAQNPAMAAVARYLVAPKSSGGGGSGGGQQTQSKSLSLLDMAKQYASMLGKGQQGVLDALLADSRKRNEGQMASLAGFGAALQGYSRDLWGTQSASEQAGAAAQQSAAQGLAGQVGSGIAGMRAQEASLAGQLGYSGASQLPTAEQAAAQVNSEGGARTGEMMSQVGTAWGGYGATRPEYIGFMTGQNQMQLAREQISADRDLKNEFLKLGMGNMETGIKLAQSAIESKATQSESAWKRYMDKQNLGLEISKMKLAGKELGIKDKQFWAELDTKQKQYDNANAIDWAGIGIQQQNADTAVTRAQNTLTGKANTAYNSTYSKLYDLAKGGNNSPLYIKGDSRAPLPANATAAQIMAHAMAGSEGKSVTYKKKPYAQARAALLARAQPFIAQYGAQGRAQILRDVDYILSTMGWVKPGTQRQTQSAGGTVPNFFDMGNPYFPDVFPS